MKTNTLFIKTLSTSFIFAYFLCWPINSAGQSATSQNISGQQNLVCTVMQSGEIQTKDPVTVSIGSEAVFGHHTDYHFKIKSMNSRLFELEIYEVQTPARNYATGVLESQSDQLKWAYWSREIWIEASCRLALP